MNFKKTVTIAAITTASILLITSCKKESKSPENPSSNTDTPSYTVPTTYDFGSNMNYKEANQRLNMVRELVTYIRSAHSATANVVLDASKLRNMYSNLNNPFADAGGLSLNTSGKSVKEKTSNRFGFQSDAETIFTEAASVSQLTVSGSDGQAGKVLGPAPSSTTATQAAYLLNAKGFEYKELIEKGLMGSFFYAEAMQVLKNIGGYDNSTIVTGEGTAMEHAWDEAFAYFGVPVAFPSNTVGLLYWGSYCNSVNSAINCNSTIMNAWLKGRAAISNKDYPARDAARDVVVATWEKSGAAKLIAYLKQAKTNFANNGQRNHALSEAVGFVKAFRYNPSKTISDADINLLLGYIGDNLYQVSLNNLDAAIDKIATVFSIDASKL